MATSCRFCEQVTCGCEKKMGGMLQPLTDGTGVVGVSSLS